MSADLVLLVADTYMEAALRGLLARPQSLCIHAIHWKPFVHPGHDPGCLKRGHDFLRPMSRDFEHALVLFDRDGCGREDLSVEELEKAVEKNLFRSGWSGRARTIVIQPELEAWVWAGSRNVCLCLGWSCSYNDLRMWIEAQNLWNKEDAKPHDPKKAVELALRKVGKSKSSSIYEKIARQVSFEACTDASFIKLKSILESWFPKTDHQ
jgi:hypothetical protein